MTSAADPAADRTPHRRPGRALVVTLVLVGAVAVTMLVVVVAPVLLQSGHATTATGCTSTAPAEETSTVDGRSYTVHVPAGAGSSRLPVILAFHGAQQTRSDIERYSDLDTADAVVVYPQGREYTEQDDGGTVHTYRGWSPDTHLPDLTADLDFTRAVLAAVERTHCVDPHRVYATGKSEGGGFAAALACEPGSPVTAIAPVAGAFYRPASDGLQTCADNHVSVLELHGAQDTTIPFGGSDRSLPILTVGSDDGWLDGWAARDGCGAQDASSQPAPDVVVHAWAGCADGTSVHGVELLDGGHTWPGATSDSGGGTQPVTHAVDATTAMLAFFGIARS